MALMHKLGAKGFFSDNLLSQTEIQYRYAEIAEDSQRLAEKFKCFVFFGHSSANLCDSLRTLRTVRLHATQKSPLRLPHRGATFTGRQSRSKRRVFLCIFYEKA